MTLARTHGVALVGVTGHLIEVEAHLGSGLPTVVLVGLPDAAVSEARDRVRAAVVNSGHSWPQRRITLGLSPASLPKRGSGFDLALAVAVLAASSDVPLAPASRAVFLGELGLDGRIRGIRGILPAVSACVAAGHRLIVVPAANAGEAALVPDAQVVAAAHLRDLVGWLRGELDLDRLAELAAKARWTDESDRQRVPTVDSRGRSPARPEVAGAADIQSWAVDVAGDLADVRGQAEARYAVEVAAAGGHHLLLHGPPGTGKSMLALRLPGLLPPLTRAEALEVSSIHSVAGTLPSDAPLITRPPVQEPHHTATAPAVLGGGTSAVRPGAVSLAHRGILLMDEAPEFATAVLEGLRQPMERGSIVVARAGATVRFPARFRLIMTANPCPCGLAGGSAVDCDCTPAIRRRYAARLSGPILDRIDIRQAMVAPTRAALATDAPESTEIVGQRVAGARERQARRLAGTPWSCNADVPGPQLRRALAPETAALDIAEEELRKGVLTARGVDRTMRVAWSVADLRGRDRPGVAEMHIALGLRGRAMLAA